MIMPEPVCATVFDWTLHWYGVFMALGFAAGLLHLTLLGRRENRDSAFVSDLVFWILIGAIVGARLAHVLSNPREFLADPIQIFRVDKGGLVFFGGFFGAWFTVWRFARARREPLLRLFDFTVTALPLGHAFGRLGCLFNSCCHGIPHDGPLAITYPAFSGAWHYQVDVLKTLTPAAAAALPVFPVQFFEAVANFLIFAVLVLAYRRPHRNGAVLALYFILYPLTRFSLEFLRGDKGERLVFASLSSAQWISLAMIAGALAFYAWLHRPTAPTHDNHPDRPA